MTELVKKYENVVDPRLARHIEHDERSKAYRAVVAPVEIKSVRWQRIVDLILNQLDLGSCTGNAGLGCILTSPYGPEVLRVMAEKGLTADEAFAVVIYSEATKVDAFPGDYPPEDTGSSGLAVAKVLQSMGLISGYTHAFGFDELCAALQSGPVIVGVDWYNGFYTPDAEGIVRIGPGETPLGGHEFVLDELDVERQLVGATNSWGADWGLSGRFYIPFDVMRKLLEDDGDVTVFVPLTAPAPEPVEPTPLVEEVVEVASESDANLWSAVSSWAAARHVKTNKAAATAVTEWAKKKGLTT